MAILGESFKPYVRDQINVRQDKLSLQGRNDDILKYITSKTSFLRLTSGVDISEGVAQNLGVIGLSGNLLAKQYVLFSSRFNNNTLVSKDPDIWGGDLTSNIGYKGYSTSYGFASDPNYGLVPPPGLTMATINTLNRGTIREATINLVCHNLYQFKAINALFLKLKYSLLLEWGHTLYFNNNSELVLPTEAGALNLSNDFLTGASSDEILRQIEIKRKESNGNYDAFFGVVKNFNWELQENGSYNIMVNAISQGDVIESLKVNSNLDPDTVTREKPFEIDNPIYQKSTLHYILGWITRKLQDSGTLDGFKVSPESNALNTDTLASITGLTPGYKEPDDTGEIGKVTSSLTYREGISILFPTLGKTYDQNGKESIVPQYYIKLGTLLRIIEAFLLYYDTSKNKNGSSPSIFYINHSFYDGENECITAPRHLSADPLTCLIPFNSDSVSQTEGKMDVTYFYDVTTKTYQIDISPEGEIASGLTTPISVETQSNVLDLPPGLGGEIVTSVSPALEFITLNETRFNNAIKLIDLNKSNLKNQSITLTTRSYTRKAEATVSNSAQNGLLSGLDDGFLNEGNKYIGNTMHIYVNINKIIEVLDSNIDGNGNVTIYNFLTQLLGEMSRAMCSINKFDLDYDESSNRFSIIDTAVFPLKYRDLTKDRTAKFNINLLKDSNSGGGSFITNFGLKSDVFGQISNAIAVGSQGNGNNLGSNSTPISNFNEGLTDRIIKDKKNPNTKSTPSGSWVDNNPDTLRKYEQFKIQITNGTIQEYDIDLYRNILVDLLNYDLGYYTENKQIPGTGFIPLNLQLTMDGLSGMRQYQTFDIDETLLPNEYNDRLKFITTTITHKIDTKGWETTISSLGVPKTNDTPKPVDQNIPKTEAKTEAKKTVEIEEIASVGNCSTKYKDLPIFSEFSKTLLSYKDTKNTLIQLFGNTPLAKNIFIVMAAEASKENNQFRSSGHYNYAGVQTDSGRWGGGVDKYFNGQFCRKDAVKYRMFAAFKNDADFLKFMGDRLTAKGFNTASTGDEWVTTYINKWWSPANKNQYVKGTEKYNQKLNIYNSWSDKWNNLA